MSRKKSPAKRIERLEGQVLGMGFLLLKLRMEYGSSFGEGMSEQVGQAIKDYHQLCLTIKQREATQAAKALGEAQC